MATNKQQQNEKEQEKNSSALFQKIDLLSHSNKEDILTTEAKSNMSSTKNTKGNRQVVVATYYNPQSLFEIPKGLDLEDKSVVKDWGVKWNVLHIKYVNGEEKTINPTRDARDDDLKRPEECEIIPAEDAGYEYDEEEEEDEEDEKYICKICCDYDKEEVGIATGENGVEIIVCKSCDVDGDNYNGWGDKEESESESEEEEEEKYECADCKEKYDNGELFVWDIENGNEENIDELMEDCELRTDYKRCEGCYHNFSEKVIEFLEKKEKNMEEEEEEEELKEQVKELCVRFGVQNTLSYYEGVLADQEKIRGEEFIQINGRWIKRDKIKPKNKCNVCEKAPINCLCDNESDSEEEEEEEEEIFNCDECNINLLRDKNGILDCVRMYKNNKDIDYCKECYFKLYKEDH